MRILPRPLLLSIALLAAVLFAALAIVVFRAQGDPEGMGARIPWVVGPPPKALNRAAEGHIEKGLTVLNDTSIETRERLSGYRSELRAAEGLLVRSLRALPSQAQALAQLAALRWELDPPLTEEAVSRHLEMIATASRMAPGKPKVQERLGGLLLKMGRREEAVAYLRRTCELAPGRTTEVVRLLRENLFTAEEMLSALPSAPASLVALREAFFEESQAARWLALVEPGLGQGGHELIRAYGGACLRAKDPDRLLSVLEALGPLVDPRAEAHRWAQIATAHDRKGDHPGALEAARRAKDRAPEEIGLLIFFGDMALAAGEDGQAEAAFRSALGTVARAGEGGSRTRGDLYARLGRVEEARGRPDRAYDEYRRAASLVPGHPVASRRIAEMEAAAGRGGR